MAQFVTHIQPTLMEASHHHVPHHHKELHKDHHPKEHPKEHSHGKSEHHHKEHKETATFHSKEHSDHHHSKYHRGFRDFPILPYLTHHDSVKVQEKETKEGGSYQDSHGLLHQYQMHFIDSQGICRDYHGHGIDGEDFRVDKSPCVIEDASRPVPPNYIELQPVYGENKSVSRV